MGREATLLNQLLRHLAKLARDAWVEDERIRSVILNFFRPENIPCPLPNDLRRSKATTFLLPSGSIYTTNTLLPLPPLPRDAHMMPFLHVWFEKRGEGWCCRFHVLLLTVEKETEGVQGFAIRFESPEVHCASRETTSEASPGTHDFYHAQLGREARLDLGRGARKRLDLGSPGWLPESQPSFLLEANDPIQLFLHVLIALYGYTEFLQIVNKLDQRQRNLLRNFCQGHSFFSRIQGGETWVRRPR